MEMKRCTKCGEEKPATNEFFGACKRVKSGLKSACKECRSKEYKENPKTLEQAARVRAENEARQKDPFRVCTKCGERKLKNTENFAADKGQPEGLHCWCRPCQTEAQKRRTAANPELARARAKATREKHGGKYYANRRADPQYVERKRSADRTYHQRMRQDDDWLSKERQRSREYARELRADPEGRQRQKEAQARYNAKNPEKIRARAARGRARREAVEGVFDAQDLSAAFKRQSGRCLYCGCAVGSRGNRTKWHADHFIPISRGGTNHPENIVIACETCNLVKYNKMPWEWMPDKFSPPAP